MKTYNNEHGKSIVKKPKVNWLSALSWTAAVSIISTTMFVIGISYYVKSTGFLDGLDNRNKQIVSILQLQIQNQSESIKTLAKENKEIMSYLKLWTPMRCSPRKDERWKIIGYGLPELEERSNLLMSIDE